MGKQDSRSKTRSYNFALLIYPENPDFDKIMERVKMVDSAYILHNHDIKMEDGTPAKPHYHVLVRYKNARFLNSVADYFYLDERFVEPKNDYSAFARYLIHMYNEDKYHYAIDDIKGNDADRVKQIIIDSESTNDQKLDMLIQWIDERSLFINYRTFIKYASSQNLSGFVMGKWYFWRSVIDQYNDQFKTVVVNTYENDDENI